MPVSEVASWIRAGIEARPDVREAVARVESRGAGVRVAARVAVMPDARIEDTARGVRTIIEEILAANIGVPLAGEPTIEIRYEELRLMPRYGEEGRTHHA
jgi:hypothetical protein